ncbi:MAG: hypothetical protein WB507_05600 [Solirubrobacterales bacterium]
MTATLEAATEHQSRARAALAAALAAGPSHAYLFRGPRGAGKRAAARAFAAEILAAGAGDPGEARRRVLLDPSPHPDLVWMAPRGAQHLVEEVRERVIRAASYRPFEGTSRVFVIEAAEAMRDESQNALLKTLEEPPGYAHLILLTAEPESMLETVVSRCQPIYFLPLSPAALEATLSAGGDRNETAAAVRLSAGDESRARFLLSNEGKELRAVAIELDWRALLDSAQAAAGDVEAATRELLEEEVSAGVKRSAKDITEEAKRAARRRRWEILDLGLELGAAWLRDLAAVASGAAEVVYNRDRQSQLRTLAARIDPAAPRRGAELIQDTRRRLDLNVSEELALEALTYRLRRTLDDD